MPHIRRRTLVRAAALIASTLAVTAGLSACLLAPLLDGTLVDEMPRTVPPTDGTPVPWPEPTDEYAGDDDDDSRAPDPDDTTPPMSRAVDPGAIGTATSLEVRLP